MHVELVRGGGGIPEDDDDDDGGDDDDAREQYQRTGLWFVQSTSRPKHPHHAANDCCRQRDSSATLRIGMCLARSTAEPVGVNHIIIRQKSSSHCQ